MVDIGHQQVLLTRLITDRLNNADNRHNVIVAHINEYDFDTSKRRDGTPRSFFCGSLTLGGITREARFFKYGGDDQTKERAKRIFDNMCTIFDDRIVRPRFAGYLESGGYWVLAYDQFENFFGDWANRLKLATNPSRNIPIDRNYGPLHKQWRDIIRNLLGAIEHLHDRRFFHTGLSLSHNFIVIGNQPRIINVMESREGPEDEDVQQELQLKIVDMMDFRTLLRDNILLTDPIHASIDREMFFEYFDNFNMLIARGQVDQRPMKFKLLLKKLIEHPLLRSNTEKLKGFADIYHKFQVNEIADIRGFDWVLANGFNLQGWVGCVEQYPELKEVRDNGRYDTNSGYDLLRFLRQLSAHYERKIDRMKDVAELIDSHFHGFLSQLYQFA